MFVTVALQLRENSCSYVMKLSWKICNVIGIVLFILPRGNTVKWGESRALLCRAPLVFCQSHFSSVQRTNYRRPCCAACADSGSPTHPTPLSTCLCIQCMISNRFHTPRRPTSVSITSVRASCHLSADVGIEQTYWVGHSSTGLWYDNWPRIYWTRGSFKFLNSKTSMTTITVLVTVCFYAWK